MIKLNEAIYKRLVSQAQEAKDLELDHLADGVLSSIGPCPRDESEEMTYSEAELKKEMNKLLWKGAMEVVAFHDLKKIDIIKLGQTIDQIAEQFIQSLETTLGVEDEIGQFEPKLPGQIK